MVFGRSQFLLIEIKQQELIMKCNHKRISQRVLTRMPWTPLAMIVTTWLAVSCAAAFAQGMNPAGAETTSVDLNLMVAPSSPAFTLLGSEPASVPRPTQAVDLAITILNETAGLTTLPNDFSVEFAPYWIFGGRQDFSEWSANKFSPANMGRSTRFSLGTRSRTDTIFSEALDEFTTMQSTSLGVGLTVTILPGKLDTTTTEYVDWYKSATRTMMVAHDSLSAHLTEALEDDAIYKAINDRIKALNRDMRPIEEPLDTAGAANRATLEADSALMEKQRQLLHKEKALRVKALADNILEDGVALLEQLRKQVAKQPMHRVGATADVAGGIVVDFPGRVVQEGRLSRWGAWVTVGWSGPRLTGLLLGRALGNDQTSDNVSYDLGGRIILDNYKKVSFSVEGVHRNFPNREDDMGLDKSTWRVAFQADYAIGKNNSISVTLGRDFSGERSGNLISLVNLVMGFGSNRSIEN